MAEDTEDKETPPAGGEKAEGGGCRFPGLEALQREVEQRIRDNRRFLEKFLDENYVDEEAEEDDQAPEEEL
ncbi:hypothetical protein DESUT3_34900 [Desulfuromonas versatilis]|uniref:Uncharacterized protein n=1 Tax=Desulfuromonas versatilis TaxID=2802975 RepID=A0ABM8HWN2_9BACT|nr:hypothetical protein [Desulfuromonas versatilis]BCR06421.1 hypothetical protein DESUT3_34900 [Desulfuromonas versatilis]